MTKAIGNMTPSLLEPRARGGDTAEGGFSFQEQVVLSRIPMWLAQDGFTAMTRESIGDTEAKFFVPGCGFMMELVEVKSYPLIPSEFWSDVRRFQEVDAGSPGTYRWFTLASAGLSRDLKPLVNGLRRVRDPYGFYENGSAIKDNSFEGYVKIVRRLGHTEQEAHFLFEKVLIDADLSTVRSHGEALFRQSLIDHLPEYRDLANRTLGDIYANLGTFVRGRKNQPMTRVEIETKLREKINPSELPPLRPVLVYTSIRVENDYKGPGLRFDWAPFFGGETRSFLPSERWNQQLIAELRETRDWIVRHRNIRRIKLTGNRRLSASLAIGSVFSAVAGFSIEMDYRGEPWATDAHPTSDTPAYPLICRTAGDAGEYLVVSVGILRSIASEVEGDLERHGLADMPMLHLKGEHAITSPQHANIAVRAIKDSISETLSRTGSKRVDLFFAGPAVLALFLGHRLNATTPIQCYERVAAGHYVPTSRLFSATIGPE
jgi:hypothetical protein